MNNTTKIPKFVLFEIIKFVDPFSFHWKIKEEEKNVEEKKICSIN
jgi:hypothetical protein